MINTISIKNFATIANISLDLRPGFCVITGETGAGKSILIDALSIGLGDRAGQNIIRKDADKCEVCLDIELPSSEVKTWLADNDLDTDDDCQIRRIITKQGKSRCYINGTQVTLKFLKQFGSQLIKIHSQHQYMDLLSNEQQLNLLDHYAIMDQPLADFKILFNDYRTAYDHCQQLLDRETNITSEIQLLRYQFEELEQLQPQAGEWLQLHDRHKILSQAQDLLAAGAQATQLLAEASDTNASDAISQSLKVLTSIDDPGFKEAIKALEQANIIIAEAVSDIETNCAKIDNEQKELAEVEHRLSAYYDIGRKQNTDPELLHEHWQELGQQLKQCENISSEIATAKATVKKLQKKLTTAALKLRKLRSAAAPKLALEIAAKIQTLGMQHAKINIVLNELSTDQINVKGMDRVEILIQSNLGEEFKPLKQIASGGELSRLSLALEVITSQHYPVPCLVFDEVDVGIGGQTATKVGHLLQQLGKHRQILCITHQAQVAALAHQHLLVEKAHQDNKTYTKMHYLDMKQRQNEIARMLSGDNSKAALKHAKELLA